MKQFNIKEVFKEYGWHTGFKFHIKFSNSGVAKIFINDRPTKYKAGGYGYDKVSTVIAGMINDLIGTQPYDKEIYGNSGNYNRPTLIGHNPDINLYNLSGGVGFSSLQESYQSLEDAKISQIYWSGDISVYEIKFPIIK